MTIFRVMPALAVLLPALAVCAYGQGNWEETPAVPEVTPEEALAVVARASDRPVAEWTDQETYTVCNAEGITALEGLERDQLLEALGEPDAKNEDGTEEWSIGIPGEDDMNPAPVLIFEYDRYDTVIGVFNRLGM
jgi:hypothetical protein